MASFCRSVFVLISLALLRAMIGIAMQCRILEDATAWLGNLSARARVGVGEDVLIAGFVTTEETFACSCAASGRR
jgi:hypothetical protein